LNRESNPMVDNLNQSASVLKIQYPQGCGGSSPLSGTVEMKRTCDVQRESFFHWLRVFRGKSGKELDFVLRSCRWAAGTVATYDSPPENCQGDGRRTARSDVKGLANADNVFSLISLISQANCRIQSTDLPRPPVTCGWLGRVANPSALVLRHYQAEIPPIGTSGRI